MLIALTLDHVTVIFRIWLFTRLSGRPPQARGRRQARSPQRVGRTTWVRRRPRALRAMTDRWARSARNARARPRADAPGTPRRRAAAAAERPVRAAVATGHVDSRPSAGLGRRGGSGRKAPISWSPRVADCTRDLRATWQRPCGAVSSFACFVSFFFLCCVGAAAGRARRRAPHHH